MWQQFFGFAIHYSPNKIPWQSNRKVFPVKQSSYCLYYNVLFIYGVKKRSRQYMGAKKTTFQQVRGKRFPVEIGHLIKQPTNAGKETAWTKIMSTLRHMPSCHQQTFCAESLQTVTQLSSLTVLPSCLTSGVPNHQSFMWSQMAFAADIALDSLRAAMIAAPRFWTVWRKKGYFYHKTWTLFHILWEKTHKLFDSECSL